MPMHYTVTYVDRHTQTNTHTNIPIMSEQEQVLHLQVKNNLSLSWSSLFSVGGDIIQHCRGGLTQAN